MLVRQARVTPVADSGLPTVQVQSVRAKSQPREPAAVHCLAVPPIPKLIPLVSGFARPAHASAPDCRAERQAGPVEGQTSGWGGGPGQSFWDTSGMSIQASNPIAHYKTGPATYHLHSTASQATYCQHATSAATSPAPLTTVPSTTK